MLNDLLLIIFSANCAALLFYYLRRLPRGRQTSLSLLVPKSESGSSMKPEGFMLEQLAHYSPRKRGAEAIAHQPAVPEIRLNSPKDKLALPVLATQIPQRMTTKSTPLPPLNLLKRARVQSQSQIAPQAQAHLITETLAAFDIPAKVVQINQGPTITQFGLQPGVYEKKKQDGRIQRRKVKVSAITALTNDLALALSAKSLRIYPVPGKPYLALEIPNQKRQLVSLASVLTRHASVASQQFEEIYQKGGLPIALGRDISGQPVAVDLAQTPHCLIAGATGSGKSVCLNAIIASLLFNYSPCCLAFVMIDPKMVELIGYNGLPHLISPVITDMDKVVGALQWAVSEMEKRYKLLSQARQRDIASYNQWAKANDKEALPIIVVIIDELADLMMTTPDDVEQLICRLAQKARAIGIHLILATQRPTVNIVTGLIKANVPTRIAFAVASHIDSKVILDVKGAESLLGRGDMLYKAADALNLQRLQGCFVSDSELEGLVAYWCTQGQGQGQEFLLEGSFEMSVSETQKDDAPTGHDKLLPKAIALTKELEIVSTSLFQRKLRIGYARAARLVDTLEERGLIGKASSRGRIVLDNEQN